MHTRFGTLVLVEHGHCQACDSPINEPAWCVLNGGNPVELRHLVEGGMLTEAEAKALIEAATTKVQP